MILGFMIFFMITSALSCAGWIITATELENVQKRLKKEKKREKYPRIGGIEFTYHRIGVLIDDYVKLSKEFDRVNELYNRYRPKDPEKDFRVILGLKSDVRLNKNMIQSAYLKKAKMFHPDKPRGSVDKMKTINAAKDYALKSIGA